MLALLLILIPLVTGVAAFFIKNEKVVKSWALLSAVVALGISLATLYYTDTTHLTFTKEWLPDLGSSFSVGLDGMGKMLTLLTAIAFPIIFISTKHSTYKDANQFYGLMLLSQAGLMGVFLSTDLLLFYFFWELALVPAYFLCSKWGGEKRISVTFKFFIYTFLGSLIMLIGILYLYILNPEKSFALQSIYKMTLNNRAQDILFWMFFLAFAIKMPIFPFHTWQPDTYEQSPTATTMVLSGIMVKMGLFAVVRWLLPVFPHAARGFDNIIIGLSVTGMIYASCIAIVQDDLKRLVAYSSIAHIGLMSAALFAGKANGVQGVMVQMFNHGINIIGLWIVIELTERQFGTRKMSELGGLAQKAPALAILLVIVALANVALPLTNGFVGEFLMFTGLYQFNVWYTVVAGLSIILAAIYTLNMIQKVFYGNTNALTEQAVDIRLNEKLVLSVLVILIFAMGVYPKPIIELTQASVNSLVSVFK
ncbi:MAG: NADH-quinone oxidoreductase subunit M [Sphingobacteriales bacterium]|nr:NADH-quinone oxidoreductase subunit M [Sphingobacteriales bacterium]